MLSTSYYKWEYCRWNRNGSGFNDNDGSNITSHPCHQDLEEYKYTCESGHVAWTPMNSNLCMQGIKVVEMMMEMSWVFKSVVSFKSWIMNMFKRRRIQTSEDHHCPIANIISPIINIQQLLNIEGERKPPDSRGNNHQPRRLTRGLISAKMFSLCLIKN